MFGIADAKLRCADFEAAAAFVRAQPAPAEGVGFASGLLRGRAVDSLLFSMFQQ